MDLVISHICLLTNLSMVINNLCQILQHVFASVSAHIHNLVQLETVVQFVFSISEPLQNVLCPLILKGCANRQFFHLLLLIRPLLYAWWACFNKWSKKHQQFMMFVTAEYSKLLRNSPMFCRQDSQGAFTSQHSVRFNQALVSLNPWCEQ